MRRLFSSIGVMCLAASAIGVGQASAAGASKPAPKPRIMFRGDARLDHPVSPSLKPSAAPPPPAAGLTIVPTFDTSITSNPDAASIEAGINAAIAELEAHISTPITVNIAFESVNTGLGSSSTFINNLSYATYRSDLANNTTLSAADRTALATLPVGPNNPVNGGSTLTMSLPLLRAIGESALGDNGGGFDSTIALNTPITNDVRTGPQDPDKYDLEQVTLHEITEVLGAGGGGSQLGQSGVGPLDLFRYRASGVRSFTTNTSEFAFLSGTAGKTNRGYFNQSGSGDYGDWDSARDGVPRVQDAASTPGVQKDLDGGEWLGLDLVGQTLKAVAAPTYAVTASTSGTASSPAASDAHWYLGGTTADGSATLTKDYGAPSGQGLGDGALKLTTNNQNSAIAELLTNHRVYGTRLDDVTTLSYWTYHSSATTGPSTEDASLKLVLDMDGNLSTTADRLSLVYDPFRNDLEGTDPQHPEGIQPDQWQFWNAIGGNWSTTKNISCGSFSVTAGGSPNTRPGDIANNCQNAQVVSLGVKVGVNNPNTVVAVDGVQFHTVSDASTWNYGPK